MLLRHDPFSELERLADDLFSGRSTAALPLDAYRRGDDVFVEVDLPGVDPDTIDITLDRNSLTIRAERSPAPQEGDRVFIHERRAGVVARQVFLGDHLDGDRIEASYVNGVLRLRVPVAEQAKPRRIGVATGRPAVDATATDATATATEGDATAADA